MTVSALSSTRLQDEANGMLGKPTLAERVESARYRRAGLLAPTAVWRLAMALARLELPRSKGWTLEARFDVASDAFVKVLDETGRELPASSAAPVDASAARTRLGVPEATAAADLRRLLHTARISRERHGETRDNPAPVDTDEDAVSHDGGDGAILRPRHLTPASAHRAAVDLAGELCPTRRREYPVYLAILSSLLVSEGDAGSAADFRATVNDPDARRPYGSASIRRTVAEGKTAIREAVESDELRLLLATADLPQRKPHSAGWEHRPTGDERTTLALEGLGPVDIGQAVAAQARRLFAPRAPRSVAPTV